MAKYFKSRLIYSHIHRLIYFQEPEAGVKIKPKSEISSHENKA